VQHIFSQQGDVGDELNSQALFKTIGQIRYYQTEESVTA
jgi:hypothetical protein